MKQLRKHLSIVQEWFCQAYVIIRTRLCRSLSNQEGQGTTEYAILVGVLVVIAIIAIVAFRGKLTELWDNITNAINGL
jgi:Flp pilus assembly pilin Flp